MQIMTGDEEGRGGGRGKGRQSTSTALVVPFSFSAVVVHVFNRDQIIRVCVCACVCAVSSMCQLNHKVPAQPTPISSTLVSNCALGCCHITPYVGTSFSFTVIPAGLLTVLNNQQPPVNASCGCCNYL